MDNYLEMLIMAGRRWTENDIEALCDMVGKYKIKTIAKRLDRTELIK